MIQKKLISLIFSLLIISIFSSCKKNNKEIKKSSSSEFTLYYNLAEELFEAEKYDSAYLYYNKAKSINDNLTNEQTIFCLFRMATIEQAKCDFSGSEATVIEAFKVSTSTVYNPNLYNMLGIAYEEQANFTDALKNYQMAYTATSDNQYKSIIKNNIGVVFIENKEFKKAIIKLSEVLQEKFVLKDKPTYAKVLDNLGYAYFKLNNPKAINHLTESLQIRDSIKDNYELIASYMHLSEYYLNSNPTLAQDFAQKAYNSATAINTPDDRIEAIKFQIASGNSNDVKKLALKQMGISDSINKVRQASKTQFAKIKYDFSIAQKESEKQKTQKQLYIILFFFASTIFLLIFFTIRSRNRRKLKTISYETETRISKRLHDELANDVFNALTYAETQDLQDSAKKEQLLENLDAIYTRTRNIAKENSDIDTGSNFQDNLQSMIASYISNDVNVLIQNQNTINWLSVKKEVKIAVYRTLQELLVNMKKHSQCSVVVIRFENTKKEIIINYSDNGIGTSEMLKFKNGLQNAENRILAIKGTLTFETESGKGFKAQIIVPE
ncbi:tetratricopeptide repeat-containing sensor histidine kinase [Flavobacterium aquatile]|uniref:histidine kinase n=1 Tax=Flavobacterium aquatile LMG 4008 = ATCC 11947 TaxID=1453498 RepID=A0A095U330_9FLAO|nr:tetratricopeptide repeat-containing sensor histidine kinase [Flavobacterium aquatile]KGD68998.1 hypothetical protein LG45_05025 [Flavobacterium aquatile LMG 4008 = ATCC 11947]OXA65712.1 ATP-binding protein [Flavobacterium aquatile] [Flavobacterium aquatile LMG 4008 = ATCC 11947]GEC78147.1 hypothetical protein FAQ01_10170 [Flavobacterium aquatile]